MSEWKEKIIGELGYTFTGLSGKNADDFGEGKPFIPYMNIFTNGKIDISNLEYVKIKRHEKQNTVKKGDLFFTTSSETFEEVGMTSVLLEDIEECYLNSFCFGFSLYNFDDLIPEFVPYLFRGETVRRDISILGQGSTRYNLPKTELLNRLKLNLPPLPTQRKIARILSTADAVVEKTQAAIAKYKAIKQGMLHDLFTRGIDLATGTQRPAYKDASHLYKPSKLGWIPKEWEDLTFKDMCIINQGLQIPISSRFKNEGKNRYVYITIQYLNNIKDEFYRYFIESPPESVICYEDDILMTRTGNTGKVVSNIMGVFHNNFFKVDYKRNNNKKYIINHLEREDIQNLIMNYAGTTTIPDLKHSDFYKLPFFKPQIKEQELIADRLTSIESKIQTEQNYLHKLQQIKAGLMADLLSGKKAVNVEGEAIN